MTHAAARISAATDAGTFAADRPPGPITAMNGVLLFGRSTAVIFEVLRRAAMIARPRKNYSKTYRYGFVSRRSKPSRS